MSKLPLPAPTRTLGTSGIEVSTLAWGMWRLERDDAAALAPRAHAALEAGITLFDTADIYGYDGRTGDGFGYAEAMLGQLLRSEPGLRDRIVLATKGGIRPPLPYDQSGAYIAQAIDASLARLGVETIDLWQIHRPDILVHPAELARAIDTAHTAGKIRAVGVSNFTPSQIATLQHFLNLPIVATQPELSPLRPAPFENGESDQALAMDMAILAWSPLGGGRMAAPTTPRERAVAAALDAVADTQGVSRSVAAYSWLMAHPAGVIPIVGSQRPERIREAAQAWQVEWARQAWYEVLVAARGERLP